MTNRERPLDESGEHRQEDQASLVEETGNGPSDADEEAVLADLYGQPDDDGVYRGGDGE